MTEVSLKVLSLASISIQLQVMQNKSDKAKNAVSNALQNINVDIKAKENILESLNAMNSTLNALTDMSSGLKTVFQDATSEILQADYLSGSTSSSITDRIQNPIETNASVTSFIINNAIKKILGVAGLFIPGAAGLGIITILNIVKNLKDTSSNNAQSDSVDSSSSHNGASESSSGVSVQEGTSVSDSGTSSNVTTSTIAQNILNDSTLGLSEDKKRTLAAMADALLNEGYEPAFVAGMLGNFACEGSFGMFESSKYISHPEMEPDYLVYMDQNWDYRSKYSGQSIVGKSLSEVYSMICDIEKQGFTGGSTRRGFGLGCAQWTFGRTKGLIEKYMEVAGSSDTITAEQAIKAEGLFMVEEINTSYHSVYDNWKAANAGNLSSAAAADSAGRFACTQYEKPACYNEKQVERGAMAAKIYNVMMQQLK